MDFEIDPTISALDNFHKIVLSALSTPIPKEVYVPATFYGVTPSAANGYVNTRCLIKPAVGADINGSANIYYKRLLLSENQPGAGTRVMTHNADNTHAKVLQRIAEHYGIIPSECTIEYPKRAPFGKDKQTYKLTPKFNSVLYRGSTLTVSAENIDAFVPVTPTEMFGNPTAIRNERLVFTLPMPSWNSFMSNVSELASLCRLLDYTVDTNAFKFKTTDIVLSNFAVDGTTGYVFVDFEPGPGSPLSAGGTFRIRRQSPNGWRYCPTNYRSLFSGQEFIVQGMKYNKLPVEKFTWTSWQTTGANRRGYYSMKPGSLFFSGGTYVIISATL